MKKIHKLSPLLISKIAAGEVVERPAYAVKELIENAIDAKASDITIYIEEAGLKKIQVIDNGEGMSEEDVQQAWEPHTTSKIQDESELHAMKSFGFRGEALASLAAVSRLTIRSRLHPDVISREVEIQKKNGSPIGPERTSKLGYEIIVENGKLIKGNQVGMAPGTIVIAEHLFASIPARKKFLKSSQTELRHIIDVVNYFAIAHPNIRFHLTHGKRILLEYLATDSISERIEQLIGSDTFSFFIPVKKSESYLTVTGFIAKPQISSSTQNKQYVFINSRKVVDKLIAQAVKEAFGTMLEATTYPLFVLFLSVPYEMVDVNVHPRKEQVSFVNNQFIFQSIKQCISEVLEENNLTFQNLSWKRTGVGMTKSFAGKLLKEQVLEKEAFLIDNTSNIFQLNKLYIVITTKKGLLLVDQHAAHERILFEKLKKEFINQKNKHNTFALTKPITINITQSENALLDEYKNVLYDLGFKMQDAKGIVSSPNTFTSRKHILLTHLPALFQDRDAQQLIKDILESLAEGKGLQSIDKVSEEMLAFLACRAAVKAGDLLSKEHMEKIFTDLGTTQNNVTCPHGRPTQIILSQEELNHMFGR